MDEGERRLKKIQSSNKSGRDLALGFMKYSFENTQLKFRWSGDDPLTDVTPVEESLISLISAVVTVQQISGQLLIDSVICIIYQTDTSPSVTPPSSSTGTV